MLLRTVSVDALTIEDERSVAHVAVYDRLARALRRSGHRFRIPAGGATASWDRVLFLNLTYWSADGGADVLCDDHIPADVIAHVAWHHVASRELARRATTPSGPPTAAALFFAESIASAFDLYLVGRLLGNAADSDFITTQVPLLAECAAEAGVSAADFEALMQATAREPERAFEDLRSLLLDVATALLACEGAEEAMAVLDGFAGHRFAPLLHHYQLSNWILYARAYAARPFVVDPVVVGVDATLRTVPVSLDWLSDNWIDADLAAGSSA